MGIASVAVDPHWNYFLALDADLVVLSRYIEFAKANYRCYSLEMTRVLLAAAAEVDVVCKQLCRAADPTSRANRIPEYRKELKAAYPGIARLQVQIPRFGLILKPWSKWNTPKDNPVWWDAYNGVKHHRHTDYKSASLHNTLNAVAGLYVLLLHLHREKARLGMLIPDPQLLRPMRQHSYGVAAGSPDGGIVYRLP
jgi:hypothetical protein